MRRGWTGNIVVNRREYARVTSTACGDGIGITLANAPVLLPESKNEYLHIQFLFCASAESRQIDRITLEAL